MLRTVFTHITNLVIFLITLSAVLLFAEYCSGVFVKGFPQYESRTAFRQTRPKAYADAPYFSQEFLMDSRKAISLTFDGKIRRLADYNSKYINVVGGRRKTAFVPENAVKTVHVFGASTIFSSEVPDEFTIPSFLQRKLNERGNIYRVVNYGVPAINAEQQLYILREVNLKIGDIVIFYDGGCDIYYNVFAGYEHGVAPNNPDGVKQAELFNQNIIPTLEKLRFGNFAKVLQQVQKRAYPPSMLDTDAVTSRSIKASHAFASYVEQASQYSKSAGAEFYHFLQPTLFSLSSRSAYEKYLLENYLLTPSGLELAFELSFDKFVQETKALNAKGVVSFDISHVLDHHPTEVYLDFAHMTEQANEIIAASIFEYVHWPNP